jgi:hypothetical protein
MGDFRERGPLSLNLVDDCRANRPPRQTAKGT